MSTWTASVDARSASTHHDQEVAALDRLHRAYGQAFDGAGDGPGDGHLHLHGLDAVDDHVLLPADQLAADLERYCGHRCRTATGACARAAPSADEPPLPIGPASVEVLHRVVAPAVVLLHDHGRHGGLAVLGGVHRGAGQHERRLEVLDGAQCL